MQRYRAALVGCSRMGAFIDNEVPPPRRPYSHAAGYEACERTDMVACSDLRPEVMEQVGRRYGVPADRQYTDYRQMIEAEKPEILSVATQPEQRREVVVFAAAHGVRAIYAEKAFSASLADADAMVEACEAHGVVLNMGTNRRWDPGVRPHEGGHRRRPPRAVALAGAAFDGDPLQQRQPWLRPAPGACTPTGPWPGCRPTCPAANPSSTATG